MPASDTRPLITLGGLKRAAVLPSAVGLLVFYACVTWPGKLRGDLVAFMASGYAVEHGLNPYLRPDQLIAGSGTGGPNANPPLSLLVFGPLSRLDGVLVARGLYVLSLLVYLGCLAWMGHAWPGISRRRLLWALLMAAPWYTLVMGQIYILLLPLVIGALLLMEKGRDVPAGILMGCLVAIKPNLALWPALLCLAGHRKAALAAATSALALSAIPLFIYGPGVYAQWWAVGHGLTAKETMQAPDMSLTKVLALLGLERWILPLDVLVVAGAALVTRRSPMSLQRLSALGIALALWLAPRAWVGYLALLLPFFLWTHLGPVQRLSGALLLIPAQLPWYLAQEVDGWAWLTWIAPLMLVTILVSILHAREAERATRAAEEEAPPINVPARAARQAQAATGMPDWARLYARLPGPLRRERREGLTRASDGDTLRVMREP